MYDSIGKSLTQLVPSHLFTGIATALAEADAGKRVLYLATTERQVLRMTQVDPERAATFKDADDDTRIFCATHRTYASGVAFDCAVVDTTGSLKVNVEKGVVTLKGELLWTYQRDKVNKVVGALNGVKGVISNITVKSAVADSEVLNGIKQALTRRAAIDANRINVKVNGSVVTLEGSYSTWPEHDIVIDAAARTRGVTSVKDELSYRL